MIGRTLSKIIRTVFSREVIFYVIAGVLATLVNIAVFTLLTAVFGTKNWWISNAPAILAAVLFAFFTNRIFVFRSNGPIWQELGKFLASRLAISLVFEYGAMFLLINLIGYTAVIHIWRWDLLVAKILTQGLVIIGNYVLSKWYIFNARTT
jgi:putative flippase GtrA